MPKGNRKAKNCWGFWNCPRKVKEKCPVYLKGLGRACWAQEECFSDSDCLNPGKKKIEYCWECLWFKKLNPGFRPKINSKNTYR